MSLAWAESGDSGLRDARLMILRRRPRAAYVALGEAMLAVDPRVREGAAWVFADLDARMRGIVEPGHVPPWTGPEREVVLGRLESLLGDPHRDVRYAAAAAFESGIAGPRRPSWATVLGHVERESDEEARNAMLMLLATREAPAAARLVAARLHAPDWILASWMVEGTVVEANRALLEREFELGGHALRVAILKEAEGLSPPQPWLAGLLHQARSDPDPGVHATAAELECTHLGTTR